MDMEFIFIIMVMLLGSMLICTIMLWALIRNRNGEEIFSKKKREKVKRVRYLQHDDTKGALVVDYKTIPTYKNGILKYNGKVTVIVTNNSRRAECYISDIQYNGKSLFYQTKAGFTNADKVNHSLGVLRRLRDKGIITSNLVYTIEEVVVEVYEFNILLKKGTVYLTKDRGYTYNFEAK